MLTTGEIILWSFIALFYIMNITFTALVIKQVEDKPKDERGNQDEARRIFAILNIIFTSIFLGWFIWYYKFSSSAKEGKGVRATVQSIAGVRTTAIEDTSTYREAQAKAAAAAALAARNQQRVANNPSYYEQVGPPTGVYNNPAYAQVNTATLQRNTSIAQGQYQPQQGQYQPLQGQYQPPQGSDYSKYIKSK